MAGGCNKFFFVDPGHIFGWNLMKLGMGPLFDIVSLQKWPNSVHRTVRRLTGRQNRRPFFSRFEPFGVDLQKIFFGGGEVFIQKNLEKFRDLSR